MAKRFQFRLETVLGLRSQEVKDAQNRLGEAVQIRNAKEQEIEEKQKYYNSLMEQAAEKKLRIWDMEVQWYHARAVEREIKELEKQLVSLEEIVEIRRTELSEAMKKEKVLTKLKDKKHALHIQEEQRAEQNFLDEIAQRT